MTDTMSEPTNAEIVARLAADAAVRALAGRLPEPDEQLRPDLTRIAEIVSRLGSAVTDLTERVRQLEEQPAPADQTTALEQLGRQLDRVQADLAALEYSSKEN